MQLRAPSLVFVQLLRISAAQSLQLLLLGSLSFTTMHRLQRGPLRASVLLLLALCISAPLLLIEPLHITGYLQRMTIAVTCTLSSLKQLELALGTTLPGVLDSRRNWLVRSIARIAAYLVLYTHTRCSKMHNAGLLLQQCGAAV
jgi:hypothetical protein